ncbi:hypothetical protein Tco_0570001 [Tanacetum coccineum]
MKTTQRIFLTKHGKFFKIPPLVEISYDKMPRKGFAIIEEKVKKFVNQEGIHGNNEAIDNTITSHCGSSVWKGILKATARLKLKGVDLLEYCKIVNGNGNTFKFWHDKWLGDVHLKDKCNRCFNLDLQKDASIAFKLQYPDLTCSFRRQPRSGIEETQFLELSQLLSLVTLSPANNRWSWSLNGNGAFSVKSAREVIDKKVWICQKSLENSQKRTREWMSDQEAKEIEAKAREIMPQPSTKSTAASTVNLQSQHHSL